MCKTLKRWCFYVLMLLNTSQCPVARINMLHQHCPGLTCLCVCARDKGPMSMAGLLAQAALSNVPHAVDMLDDAVHRKVAAAAREHCHRNARHGKPAQRGRAGTREDSAAPRPSAGASAARQRPF